MLARGVHRSGFKPAAEIAAASAQRLINMFCSALADPGDSSVNPLLAD